MFLWNTCTCRFKQLLAHTWVTMDVVLNHWKTNNFRPLPFHIGVSWLLSVCMYNMYTCKPILTSYSIPYNPAKTTWIIPHNIISKHGHHNPRYSVVVEVILYDSMYTMSTVTDKGRGLLSLCCVSVLSPLYGWVLILLWYKKPGFSLSPRCPGDYSLTHAILWYIHKLYRVVSTGIGPIHHGPHTLIPPIIAVILLCISPLLLYNTLTLAIIG